MSSGYNPVLLAACRRLGLFKLSAWLTRRALRILCYHNFAARGQHVDIFEWDPWLTLYVDTFNQRLAYLLNGQFEILPLSDALERLYAGQLTRPAVVITIDDGWYSIKQYAHPILHQLPLPYTVYLTSYYSANQVPIFNIYVSYAFTFTTRTHIDLNELGIPGGGNFDLSTNGARAEASRIFTQYCEQNLSLAERQTHAMALGDYLGVSYVRLEESRVLHLLSSDDIRQLSSEGVDFQLHTHRHRFPSETDAATEELTENRSYLHSLIEGSFVHFCYPSGQWKPEHFPVLEQENISSAVTCDLGLNTKATDPFALKRFLDSESYSQLDFEAEVSGFTFLLRHVQNRLSRMSTKLRFSK